MVSALSSPEISSITLQNTTFVQRLKYFFWITDPRLCLINDKFLDDAKICLDKTRGGQVLEEVTPSDVIHAKRLYDCAFHPDTGEKQNLFGRMCFQVPGGMAITGAMLSFYRTNSAIIFWQWVNQSFNAIVNYTNRNANSPLTEFQLGTAYCSATFAACFTAIKFKAFLTKSSGPLLMRYIPFAAVAAANCVNIPFMRQNEITKGISVLNENGSVIGTSRVAAVKGIGQVVVSRIIMCAPGMLLLPVVMEKLCINYAWFRKYSFLHAPFQTFGVGCLLIFMVPTACAIFPQHSSIKVSTLKNLEPNSYNKILTACQTTSTPLPTVVYYNKGL